MPVCVNACVKKIMLMSVCDVVSFLIWAVVCILGLRKLKMRIPGMSSSNEFISKFFHVMFSCHAHVLLAH